MNLTISVLMPTRGRPDLLQQAINSFYLTRVYPETELVLRIDTDDRDTNTYLSTIVDECDIKIVNGSRYNGYASSPQFYRELIAASTGTLLMPANDDMIFRTSGWDLMIIEAFQLWPDLIGSVSPNALLNPDANPWGTVSRKWTDCIGGFAPQELMWTDAFVRDVSRALGRYQFLEHIIIEHVWAQHRRQEAREQESQFETPQYWRKHGQCVADAVSKLRPLMKDYNE